MERRHLFAANWKMHKTVEEAVSYFQEFKQLIHTDADIYIAPAFTALFSLAQLARNTRVLVGAQNMNDVEEGAFTGEISVRMLKEAGASFVILGHSERRRNYGEENSLINRKIHLALQNNLEVLLCVGETAAERSSGKTQAIIENQLQECLSGVAKDAKITVAYEPVWAIGNGHAATPNDAQEMHQCIRKWLDGKNLGQRTRILYGGSVNAKNALEFLKEKDIDGLLVGSASLNPQSFSEIVNLG